MRTEAAAIGWPTLRVSASTLATALLVMAVALSSIVFSEPAPADVLMAGAIVAIPLLGSARFGAAALMGLFAWVAVVAFGLVACGWAATPGSAITHQLVTLFLALGAFVIAGYVTQAPEVRGRIVINAYVVGCLIACAAALVGYFRLIPGAYDLFTNFGRARGTFKDPNVFGAALVMALAYAAWMVFRESGRKALLASAVALPLALCLLLSFSRGAWFCAVVAVGAIGWFCAATSRRRSDTRRLTLASLITFAVLSLALGAASQLEAVRDLLSERASMNQSYDHGPEGRFGGQAKARALIVSSPLGIGTHTFRDRHHHEEPHNVYLTTFLNSGWVGGFAYIAVVVGTIVIGIRGALRNGHLQMPYAVATATFLALAIEGFVIDSDHWRHFFIPMALVWGLVDGEAPRHRRADRRAA